MYILFRKFILIIQQKNEDLALRSYSFITPQLCLLVHMGMVLFPPLKGVWYFCSKSGFCI